MAQDKLKIGVVGAGSFANHFLPLFSAHPLVAEVRLAERMPERREQAAAKHTLAAIHEDFDELLRSDVDAIGVFTQRWTHAPFVLKALRAGKHVFSSVPAGISIEQLEEIIDTVRTTGQLYMLGETSYYEGPTVLCRKLYRRGAFGRFVYAQSGYCHDMEHNFYPPYQIPNGPNWKQFASFPPMLYPTHSVGQMLSVTGGRMARVACFGQGDNHEDGIFDRELSYFDNDFSNETALFQAADGGIYRANEFRRVTGGDPLVVHGTRSAFQGGRWLRHDRSEVDLSDQLARAPVTKPDDWEQQRKQGVQEDFFCNASPVHDVERLPREFDGLPNGHGGSHHFLADDFIHMCATGQQPVLNAWTAARFCAPGIIAHQSALRDGESMAIPDLGAPPEDVAIMDIELSDGKAPPIEG